MGAERGKGRKLKEPLDTQASESEVLFFDSNY